MLTSAEPPRCKSDKSASRRLSQTDGDSAAAARLDSRPVSTPAPSRLLPRVVSCSVSTPSRLDSCSCSSPSRLPPVSTPVPSRLLPRLDSRPVSTPARLDPRPLLGVGVSVCCGRQPDGTKYLRRVMVAPGAVQRGRLTLQVTRPVTAPIGPGRLQMAAIARRLGSHREIHDRPAGEPGGVGGGKQGVDFKVELRFGWKVGRVAGAMIIPCLH